MCAATDPPDLSDPGHLGRLLTRLEDDPLDSRQLLAGLPAPADQPHRVGVTGSPGAGKSTLLRGLIRHYLADGHRVGIVAVDPTSPLSGGAILGDRVRLGDVQDDPGVFIRSLGSRGSLGGVTPGASAVASVLEAAGYSRILIETVGVGQTGYDVICLADTVVALFTPEGGDAIQLLKAGILEIGDIYAVNKCDRPGADLILREILLSTELSQPSTDEDLHHGLASPREAGAAAPQPALLPDGQAWQPPVLRVIAQTGEGVEEVHGACEKHRAWLAGLPTDHPRRRQRLTRELAFVMRSRLTRLLDDTLATRLDALAARVQAGELGIWEAVEQLRQDLADQL
jgi:LAO/AO transport system kinase